MTSILLGFKLQVTIKKISLTQEKGYLFEIFPVARLEGWRFSCVLSDETAQRVLVIFPEICIYAYSGTLPDRLPGTIDDQWILGRVNALVIITKSALPY